MTTMPPNHLITGWRPLDEPVPCKPDSMVRVIIAVESDNGRRYSIPAWYLNAYPLSIMDEGDLAGFGPYDADECVRRVTGFFEECASADFDEAYRPVREKMLSWQPFPAPPAKSGEVAPC